MGIATAIATVMIVGLIGYASERLNLVWVAVLAVAALAAASAVDAITR